MLILCCLCILVSSLISTTLIIQNLHFYTKAGYVVSQKPLAPVVARIDTTLDLSANNNN